MTTSKQRSWLYSRREEVRPSEVEKFDPEELGIEEPGTEIKDIEFDFPSEPAVSNANNFQAVVLG